MPTTSWFFSSNKRVKDHKHDNNSLWQRERVGAVFGPGDFIHSKDYQKKEENRQKKQKKRNRKQKNRWAKKQAKKLWRLEDVKHTRAAARPLQTETYSEPCQTSQEELFVKTVNGFQ